jgi:uncharacterized membrane protein
MEKYLQQFNTTINKNIYSKNNDDPVLFGISLFLCFYIAFIRSNFSKCFIKLFNNTIFRLVILVYIIYYSKFNPRLSLMMSLAFLITIHMINKQKAKEYSKCKDTN